MRVLQVLPTFDISGPANVCSALSRDLVRRGIEVHVLSLRPSTAAANEFAARHGIVVHDLSMGPLWDSGISAPVTQLIRRLSPDVVHNHGLRPDVMIAPPAKAAGVPAVLSTIHNRMLEDYGMRSGWLCGGLAYLWQRHALLHHHDAVVFVSETCRRHVEHLRWFGLRHRLARVIHNGVDIEPTPAAEAAGPPDCVAGLRRPGSVMLAAVGALIKLKNHAATLRACSELKALGHDWDLLLVGEGDQEQELRRLAAQLHISDNVHFLGWRPDVAAILQGVDVLVHTSLSEGMCLVLMEAAMLGVPVLATTVGGIPEIVEDGRTGLLVEPNRPGELTKALERLVSGEKLRRELAAGAREHARANFSSKRMTDGYVSLYDELIG